MPSMIKFCLVKGPTMEVSERLTNISICIDCNSVCEGGGGGECTCQCVSVPYLLLTSDKKNF